MKEQTVPQQPQRLCDDVQDLEERYGFGDLAMLVKESLFKTFKLLQTPWEKKKVR